MKALILAALAAFTVNLSMNRVSHAQTPSATATPSPAATPAATPTPMAEKKAGKPCKIARDCRGPLPHYCLACMNGKSGGCAHWSCVENQCKIATCDLDKGGD